MQISNFFDAGVKPYLLLRNTFAMRDLEDDFAEGNRLKLVLGDYTFKNFGQMLGLINEGGSSNTGAVYERIKASIDNFGHINEGMLV